MKNDVSQERISYRRVPLGGAPYRRLIRVCGVFAAGTGLAALLGWGLGLPFLASLAEGRIPMAPSTALLFLLFGTAAFVRAREPLSRGAYWMGVAINSAGALAASLLLFLSLEGIHPDAEHLGFPEVSTLGEVPVGHMSPVTAVCFLLASLSFLASLPSSPSRRWRAVAAVCLAGLLTAASSVLLLAYLLGDPLFYVGSFIPPAATTSLAFVALGIAMLALAGPQAWPISERTEAATRVSYRFVLVFVLLATGIVTTGGLYQRNYEKHYRAEIERQLSAIAELKVGELVQWRKERMGDAAVFYGNKNFSDLIKRHLDAPGDVDARERIQMWLRQVQSAYQYDRVFLLDAENVERVSAPDTPEPVAQHLMEHGREILQSGQVVFLDFHRDAPDLPVWLSVLVPILDEQDGRRPLGILVLRIDPETYLYPLINRWPTPSRTAETLIVRREGNEAVFLNELRFQKDTALKLRSPLEDVRMPVVQAALGREGIVEGVDYRGVPVVAHVCGIPDSPWFLVARMDVTEIYAPLRQRLWLTIALISALLLGAGAGVGLVWRQQRVRFYQERYEAAEALRETNEYLENLFNYANAPIIVWDPQFRITRFNHAFEKLTGRKAADVIGKPLEILFPPALVESSMDLIRKTLSGARWETVEIATLHLDGSVRTVLWNSANVLATDGKTPVATIAQGQDITERKRAEEKLLHLTEVLRAVRNVNQLITHEKDRDVLLRRACGILTETRGYRSAWIGMLDAAGAIHAAAESGVGDGFASVRTQLERGDWPECCRKALGQPGIVIMHDTAVNCVKCPVAHTYRDTAALAQRLHHAGHNYGVLVVALPATEADDDEEQSLFRELCGDVSFALHAIEVEQERRRAEKRLRESQASLVEAQAVAHLGSWAWDPVRDEITGSDEFYRLLGVKPEQLARYRQFINLLHPDDRARVEQDVADAMKQSRPYDTDYRVLLPNGEYRHINARGQVFVDDTGKLIRMVGTCLDITERKQAEERIAHLNRVLRAIRDVNQLIVREKDEERIIQAACALLVKHRSYHGGMIILCDKTGAPWAYAKAGKSDEAFRPLAEGLKNGVLPLCCEAARTHEGVCHISDRGGVCAPCPIVANCMGSDTLCIRLTHDGVIHGYTAVSMEHAMGIDVEEQSLFAEMAGDIAFALHGMEMERQRERMESERLAMEAQWRQQQRLESIGTLAGGVAHEINNPLNGIMNYAQLIVDRVGDRDESVKEFASEIILETERIASIVKSLLTFARCEKQSYSPARLEDIVNAVLNLVRTLIRHDQIALDVAIPEGLPSLCCRSQQIQQVLLNLVTNARDGLNARFPGYDPEKKLAISARTFEKEGGLWLRMTVEDHGSGISERSREHVFDPFFTTKPKETGTGLGLSLSHGIVTEHGGQISFESEPNVCTRFHVDLPAAP